MGVSKKTIVILFSFALFFSFSLVSGLTWTKDYTLANVNSSDFWDNLDTPADFLLSMFDGPNWIDEDLNLNGQNIVGVADGYFEMINTTFLNVSRIVGNSSTDFVITQRGLSNIIINTSNPTFPAQPGSFLVKAGNSYSASAIRGGDINITSGAGGSGAGVVPGAPGGIFWLYSGQGGDGAPMPPFAGGGDGGDFFITGGPGGAGNGGPSGTYGDVFLADKGGNIIFDQDNAKFFFGEGQDASIYFNASDLIINPKAVGSGALFILGDLFTEQGINVSGDYVPYTGATKNIDLGSKDIDTTGIIHSSLIYAGKGGVGGNPYVALEEGEDTINGLDWGLINSYEYAATGGGIAINYYSRASHGTNYFRNFAIADGKTNLLLEVTGSTGLFDFKANDIVTTGKGFFESLNATGDLNQSGGNATINNIYGEMWYHNHTGTEMNFAVQDTWYPLFITNYSLLNGFSFTGGFLANSYLTAQIDGTYRVCYMATGSGQNNHVYYTTILIDDVAEEKCGSHKKMSAGGDIITMNGCCLLNFTAGTEIAVATRDYGGTGIGDYYSSNLNLVRVGDI